MDLKAISPIPAELRGHCGKVSLWLPPVWYFSVISTSFLCSLSWSSLLLQTVLRMQICVIDVLLLILLLLSDLQTLGLVA